jgi:hypothetical protein
LVFVSKFGTCKAVFEFRRRSVTPSSKKNCTRSSENASTAVPCLFINSLVLFPSVLMHSHIAIPFALLLTLFHPTFAVRLPFHVRTARPRADITTGNSTIPIANTRNAQYISNITLGGQTVPVLLDTGRYARLLILFSSLTHSTTAQTYGPLATYLVRQIPANQQVCLTLLAKLVACLFQAPIHSILILRAR